ncbi:hypothetical protein Sjap_024152 [Stephania japonica]|uniref:Uncharacterized protein n=1 Tax=Stephania japonica TaxID=461633 RepID=A0AAP0HPV8_9MAGN
MHESERKRVQIFSTSISLETFLRYEIVVKSNCICYLAIIEQKLSEVAGNHFKSPALFALSISHREREREINNQAEQNADLYEVRVWRSSCREWAIVKLQGVVEAQPVFQDQIQNFEIGVLCRASSQSGF